MYEVKRSTNTIIYYKIHKPICGWLPVRFNNPLAAYTKCTVCQIESKLKENRWESKKKLNEQQTYS